MEKFKEIEAKALAGDYSAMSELANYYIQGNVVEKNIEEGINWYEKAIKAGDDFAPQTVNDIGYNLQVGQNGYEVNLSLALRCYKIAADAGNVLGMGNYAYCNYCGTGTEKNYQAAYEYWQKAADKGDAVCLNNVGFCYEYGYGVELDLTKAIDYYFMALDNKYQNAETTIKTFCENHKGEIYTERHLDFLVKNGIITEIESLPTHIIKLPDFKTVKSLSRIRIPSFVTKIGGLPNNLISVEIENGLKEIGSGWFYNTSITEIVIPNSVTKIGDGAFSDCSNLREIVLPKSIETLGQRVFWNCTKLTSIIIPDSVLEIPSMVFAHCKKLSSIKLPNSLKKIGAISFYQCEELSNMDIPDSLTEIESDAFRGCKKLSSIKLPNSLKKIGSFSFYQCEELSNIDIPDSITEIEREAFLIKYVKPTE